MKATPRFIIAALAALVAACAGNNSTPAAPLSTAATSVVLSGQVTDSTSGAGLAGATVSIADGPNGGKLATTDTSGNYTLADLQQSTSTVTTSAANYTPQSIGITLSTSQSLVFHLTRTAPGASPTPTPSCAFGLSVGSTINGYSEGGTFPVVVTTSDGCAWTAIADVPWIRLQPASGTGNGTVTLTVDANTTATSRTGTATIGSKTVTANQDSSCTYSLSTASPISGDSNGGTFPVAVTTIAGCSWSATADSGWLHIQGPGSGTGSGTVTFSVDANNSASTRNGTVTIAAHAVTVNQGRQFPTSYQFSVTATSGPLNGQSATGTFSFDAGIVPNGGGIVAQPHFTALALTWDGVQYDQNNTEISELRFDGSGALTLWDFGTECLAYGNGGCLVRLAFGGNRDWYLKDDVTAFNSSPVFEYGRPDNSFGFGTQSVSPR